MFIMALALYSVRSTYIGQQLRALVAPSLMHMRGNKGGVIIVQNYPYPAIFLYKSMCMSKTRSNNICLLSDRNINTLDTRNLNLMVTKQNLVEIYYKLSHSLW